MVEKIKTSTTGLEDVSKEIEQHYSNGVIDGFSQESVSQSSFKPQFLVLKSPVLVQGLNKHSGTSSKKRRRGIMCPSTFPNSYFKPCQGDGGLKLGESNEVRLVERACC